MKRGNAIQSLLGAMLTAMFCAAAAHVTVHKIDDSTINGDILSVDTEHQILHLSTTRPATQPATEPTTQPATRSAGAPATQPVEIPLIEIVQVSFRESAPPPKPAANQSKSEDEDSGDSSDDSPEDSTSVSDAFSDLLGSSSSSKPVTRPQSRPAAVTATAPATEPTAELTDWNFQFTDGSAIPGHLKSWAANHLSVILDAPFDRPIQFTTPDLAELWRIDPTWRTKARALNVEAGEADVAYVEKEGNVVAVAGTALGVEGSSLRFTYDNAEKKIALNRLVGLVMGSAARGKPPAAFMNVVKLDTGAALAGQWIGADEKSIHMRTNWGQTLRIPLLRVLTIDALNGPLVYLSDLTPAKVEQTAYFGRVIGYQRDHGLDGGPIHLSDGTYAKGVAMHSRCILQYDLSGNFERFKARLGFEQPGGRLGRAEVKVLADGRAVYENADARGVDEPVNLDFDVAGCKNLTLEVDFGKDQDTGDRVVFANARLLRAKLPGQVSP